MSAVKRRKLPSQDRLKHLFDYDQGTGFLIRRVNVSNQKAGERAGNFCAKSGYRAISIDGGQYREANVIWAWMTGVDPSGIVDHRDLVRDNNAWVNLRLGTQSQNVANSPVRTTNILGVKGVSKKRGRFRVQITVDGENHHLGTFDTVEEASSVRMARAKELFGEFARLA